MESNFTITEHQYWLNTLRSVENAYCWLTTFETKEYVLVDEAITAMRKLITHGKTIDQLKQYKAPPTTPFVPKKQAFLNSPVNYNMEPNWKRVDDNTIHIDLGEGGGTAIAIAVTNEQMLDEMIKDIYKAPYIAVDCEFLGQKNTLPELKLLQIGVSKEKGYAVQVDKIGVDIMTDKLKPILESENVNIIGWSFKSDALAIECYLKHVELAPVLDLQAKLKPIAVEQLNLSAAMNRFATDWIGNTEFQKAKQYGTQFNFTGENCIWVCSPLPPRALVYAVFDVLSVIALHEATLEYPSLENQFWPFTITMVESRKAVDNWHRLRAKGINSTVGNQGVVNVVATSPKTNRTSPPVPDKGKNKAASPNIPIITTLGDGYDDENAAFKRQMELALEESKKTYISEVLGQGESSKGDRVVSSEDISYSDLAQELDAANTSQTAEPVFSTHIPKKQSNAPEILPGSWGTEVLDDQPFLGTGKKFRIDNKEIDTSINNKETNNQHKNHNRNSFNAESPAFVPKRASISSTVFKSPNINERTPPKQTESTPQESPQVKKAILASPPPPSNQSSSTSTPDQSKKGISRWNNEPTEPSSQWNDQSQQEPARERRGSRFSSESANSRWRKETPSHASWGDQSTTTTAVENQESTWDHTDDIKWGDSGVTEKQETQKFTTSGSWGNKAETKFTENKSWRDNSWNDRSNNKSSNWNDNNRNNNQGSWRDQKPNSAAYRSPAARAAARSANNTDSEQFAYRPPAARASPRSTNATVPEQASPAWNSVGSPSSMKSSPSFKPDKAKYTTELKNRISVGNQGGSFTNYQPIGNEMSSASWKSFAGNAVQDWEQLGKDTPLDAIDKPLPSSPHVQEQSKPIKFNTTAHTHYPRGGGIGDSSTGKMHGNDGNSWTQNEDRPDTMQMPMNQIPIRKVFTGPRIMNPDDSGDDDDSDDSYNNIDYDDTDFPILQMNKMGGYQESNFKSPTKSAVHQLKTFVDGKFLYSENGNSELSMLLLNAPEHLDMINIPPPGTEYTVTIGYHFAKMKDTNALKAIQLYLSTKESYTMIIDKCCFIDSMANIKKTKFGQLLTDPNIKRICWFPQFIEELMIQRLGFPIGPCVDLAYRANVDNSEEEFMNFSQAIEYYLKDWPDKQLYEEAKVDFNSLNAKKFSSSCWDRDTLPIAVLHFSAFQGLTAHALYLETLKRFQVSDENFIYEA